MKKLFVFLLFLATETPAWAANQIITLSVPGMTCEACPITVKAALFKVEGVSEIKVISDKREAIVAFDDAKTNIQALIKAASNAGYPSSTKQ